MAQHMQRGQLHVRYWVCYTARSATAVHTVRMQCNISRSPCNRLMAARPGLPEQPSFCDGDVAKSAVSPTHGAKITQGSSVASFDRTATSVRQVTQDPNEVNTTESDMGCSLVLLSCACDRHGYYILAHGMGLIPNGTQLPCWTLITCQGGELNEHVDALSGLGLYVRLTTPLHLAPHLERGSVNGHFATVAWVWTQHCAPNGPQFLGHNPLGERMGGGGLEPKILCTKNSLNELSFRKFHFCQIWVWWGACKGGFPPLVASRSDTSLAMPMHAVQRHSR